MKLPQIVIIPMCRMMPQIDHNNDETKNKAIGLEFLFISFDAYEFMFARNSYELIFVLSGCENISYIYPALSTSTVHLWGKY